MSVETQTPFQVVLGKLPMEHIYYTPAITELEFLFDRVREYQPQTMVEIGTHAGGTTAVLHLAHPESILHTYDIETHTIPEKKVHVGAATSHLCNGNVHYHPGTTSFGIDYPVDLIWVDGCHRSPEALIDVLNVMRWARFPFTLCMHDVGFEEHPYFSRWCWQDWGATQVWKSITKIAGMFELTLKEHGLSRSAHFPKDTNRWSFTRELLFHWRLNRDMDHIPGMAMWKRVPGAEETEQPF